MTGRRVWPVRLILWSALLAAGGPAAVLSFEHMATEAARLGSPTSYLYPFTSDGVVVAASAVIYQCSRRRHPAPRIAWCLLAAGIAVTVAVNAAAGSGHGIGGRLLATWPALAFVMAFECAVLLARLTADETAPDSEINEAAGEAAPAEFRHPDETVPIDNVSAARAWYLATVALGNPASVNQLQERFSLSRAEATKVRSQTAIEANGHAPQPDETAGA